MTSDDIRIGSHYPTTWSRREPWGLFLPVTSDLPHRAREVSMEGDGAGPFRFQYPGTPQHPEWDGRWSPGVVWKPGITGEWWPLVKLFATLDSREPIAMTRGPHKVQVTEEALKPVAPFQIRAIFYYPWFPYAPFSPHYTPTLGRYDSSDPAVIDAHIRAMEYGHIQAAIASWWGPGQWTDQQIPALLSRSQGHALQWALYHEAEGSSNPTVDQLRSDLTYIRDRYAWHPNYLTIDGKFVVFVYNEGDHDCSVATRWKQANTVGAYLVLKEVIGYEHCADQPDSWHQYVPTATRVTTFPGQAPHAYNITPGFWNAEESEPRLTRDLERWKQDIRKMILSGARWQLITSLNEHGEGTAIESAKEWESASGFGVYLDALHTNGVT